MKKKVFWIIIVLLVVSIGIMATLSDKPIDESERFMNIDKFMAKSDMIADLDTLFAKFEKNTPKGLFSGPPCTFI